MLNNLHRAEHCTDVQRSAALTPSSLLLPCQYLCQHKKQLMCEFLIMLRHATYFTSVYHLWEIWTDLALGYQICLTLFYGVKARSVYVNMSIRSSILLKWIDLECSHVVISSHAVSGALWEMQKLAHNKNWGQISWIPERNWSSTGWMPRIPCLRENWAQRTILNYNKVCSLYSYRDNNCCFN